MIASLGWPVEAVLPTGIRKRLVQVKKWSVVGGGQLERCKTALA